MLDNAISLQYRQILAASVLFNQLGVKKVHTIQAFDELELALDTMMSNVAPYVKYDANDDTATEIDHLDIDEYNKLRSFSESGKLPVFSDVVKTLWLAIGDADRTKTIGGLQKILGGFQVVGGSYKILQELEHNLKLLPTIMNYILAFIESEKQNRYRAELKANLESSLSGYENTIQRLRDNRVADYIVEAVCFERDAILKKIAELTQVVTVSPNDFLKAVGEIILTAMNL